MSNDRDKELREFFFMEEDEPSEHIEGTPANNVATWMFVGLMVALIIAACFLAVL